MTSDMQNISKRNVMVSAVLIIIAIAIYHWFVTPHSQYLMAAEQYQKAIDTIDKKSKILNSQIQIRRKKLENLTKEFEEYKEGYFETEQAKDFLSNLQTAAENSGCAVKNIKFPPSRYAPVKGSEEMIIHQYQANLSLQGEYSSILKFLNTIHNRPEKVWVESINFEMKNTENGDLGCDVTLSIYTLKVMERIKNVNNKQK
ncbi:MAG: hypothetical protein A2Y10_12015 [Planctomycetes bacterium GWF2_41_51]|nr:MAG: hypothetical protein A2Y10_12015 [Planctomycetes bacterium GWF2_41_51]HBG28671.1 hypothetical protein [Phycisphaerales bacterium]